MYCLPRSSFIGSSLLYLERNVKIAVENCYSFVATRVVHVAKPMLSPATKDGPQKSFVIYEYKVQGYWDSWYLERISQGL